MQALTEPATGTPELVLNQKRKQLLASRTRLLQRFQKATEDNEPKRLTSAYRQISQINDLLTSLDQIEAEMRPKSSGSNRFAVSSLFLHECFREVTADENEQMYFVTGMEVEGVFVLDQRADFLKEKRTFGAVVADTRSTHRLLIKLEQFRHRLLGHIHSHPGFGPDSTRPSGTDHDFQKRLETAGHVAVAAIFSRDGFVRFFRLDNNFEIEVFGNGVTQHARNIFRLDPIN